MIGFQSSNAVCKLLVKWLTWELFTSSTRSAESNAFSNNPNNTDTTSEEKEEYNWTKFLSILLICILEPET